MGIGTSLVLIAVGAVLRFAVTVTATGFNLHSIGVILMVIGIIGLIISLIWMTLWADRTRDTVVSRRERVVRDRDVY